MTQLPYISYTQIEEAVALKDLIRSVTGSIQKNEKQQIETPLRSLIIKENPYSCFGAMPAFHHKEKLYMVKVATFIDQSNCPISGKSVHSLVLVFCGVTGKVIGILDGEAVTNLKCAVLAAYVTNICSLPFIEELGIVGAGTMARNLVRGIKEVRNIKQLKVYSRSLESSQNFIKDISSWNCCQGMNATICSNIEEVINHSDIICTATTTPKSLIESLGSNKPIHINCMGAHKAESREVSSQILKNSFLIVEDLPTAISELGPGHKKATEICSLHEVNPQFLQAQVTVFSSTGHAAFDYLVSEFIVNSLLRQKGGCL